MIWLIIVITGIFTFLTRFLMFSNIAPQRLPSALKDALRFVPISVLTAILVPAILIDGEGAVVLAGNARLLAAGLAVIIALVSRSVWLTITGGMMALWGIDWLI